MVKDKMAEEDVDFVTVKTVDDKPPTIFFFPVITFIVLLYFNRAGIVVDDGYVSALFGVSVVSVLVDSAFVGFGIITDEWYSMTARARTIVGEIIIAILGLFSTQFTWFILGFKDYWIPTLMNIQWFIWGFIIYQFMWIVFTYVYATNDGMFKDNRANVFFGMLFSILVGMGGVYIIMWLGGGA